MKARATKHALEGGQPAVPFLKWAGGKQWLAQLLAQQIELAGKRYFEPFLGGGSVFFALRPSSALLSDNNPELINVYEVVRDDVEGLIQRLKKFRHTEDCYYRVRQSSPRSPISRAARFIYLNRTAWNGLYRVNRNGKFNVPMGLFAYEPDIVRAELLRRASNALQGIRTRSVDFVRACASVREGDVVYLDPPYTVTHNNNGFLRYNEEIFSWRDQERLASLAKRLDTLGATVIVSNAAHAAVEELYDGFYIEALDRASNLAADSSKRRPVSEYLISNREVFCEAEL